MAKKAKKAAKAAPTKKVAPAKKAKAEKEKKGPKIGTDPAKTYQAIKDIIVLMDEDIEKFLVDEVKSAGRRLRVNAMNIKKLTGVLRKEIQNLVAARKNEK